MRCMRCGRPVEFDSAVCVGCKPIVSAMRDLRRRKRASALRQGILCLVLMGALVAALSLTDRENGKKRSSPTPPRTGGGRNTSASRTAPQRPARKAGTSGVKVASSTDHDPTLPYAPARPVARPTTDSAPTSSFPPPPPSAPPSLDEPKYARRDVDATPPPPTSQRPEQSEADSTSRSTRDGGLVVGIVRVQKYPRSCVIWGYIYNSTGAKIDMNVDFKLRDAQGDLCQKATTQFQGQDCTVHDDKMLYFWPAFTWESAPDAAPEGYSNAQSEVELGNFEVSVAGRRFVLNAEDNITNLGALNALDAGLQRRIRTLLGSFPDSYLGTQPAGR